MIWHAGQLNDQVTLQSPTITVDAAGGHSYTYSDEGTYRCNIEYKDGDVSIEANERAANQRIKVTMRASSVSPLTSWRAVVSSKNYRVISVIRPTRSGWLELICERWSDDEEGR